MFSTQDLQLPVSVPFLHLVHYFEIELKQNPRQRVAISSPTPHWHAAKETDCIMWPLFFYFSIDHKMFHTEHTILKEIKNDEQIER